MEATTYFCFPAAPRSRLMTFMTRTSRSAQQPHGNPRQRLHARNASRLPAEDALAKRPHAAGASTPLLHRARHVPPLQRHADQQRPNHGTRAGHTFHPGTAPDPSASGKRGRENRVVIPGSTARAENQPAHHTPSQPREDLSEADQEKVCRVLRNERPVSSQEDGA